MPGDGHEHADLQPLLDHLAAGDGAAVDRLIEHSVKRLRNLSHFMPKRNPGLTRWYDTDDVFQSASLRLTRALKTAKPASPRDFMNLAAAQIRRELCDLARHEFGREGPGRHHAT